MPPLVRFRSLLAYALNSFEAPLARDRSRDILQMRGSGWRSPPERSQRVEAIEACEFAISFVSIINGDTRLFIISIVVAE